jgi:hypothetical protein
VPGGAGIGFRRYDDPGYDYDDSGATTGFYGAAQPANPYAPE